MNHHPTDSNPPSILTADLLMGMLEDIIQEYPSSPTEGHVPFKRHHVLLIEPGPYDFQVHGELSLCHEHQIELDRCGSLSEAVAALHHGMYDAVLVDLTKFDRRDVQWLRRENPNLSIVAMVGLYDNHGEAAQAGATECLVKPFLTIQQLSRTLSQLPKDTLRQQA